MRIEFRDLMADDPFEVIGTALVDSGAVVSDQDWVRDLIASTASRTATTGARLAEEILKRFGHGVGLRAFESRE